MSISTIFGYSWDEIQRMQQGTFSQKLVGHSLRSFYVRLDGKSFEIFSSCAHYAAKAVCEAEKAPFSAVEYVINGKTGAKVNFQ